jgi:putative ABC transport system permease protein
MLALGIGFNTALFAVVDAVLFTPLPYRSPDRVVMLWTGRNADGTGGVSSYADFLIWKQSAKSFDSIATFNISVGTLTGAGDPEELGGAVVTPEFFRVLGPAMVLGRGIEPGDEKIPLEAVRPIVIAHSLWLRRFGGDPDIVGRTMMFAGRPRRIVGVVDRGFRHPEPFWDATAEYWSPLFVTDEMAQNYAGRYLRVIARLAPGVSLTTARAEMDGIGRRLMALLPATHEQSVVVSPIQDELVGNARPLSLAFLAATALVLCLVIANVVNLLLARMNHRRAEFAIRVALGASRARLVSQALAESTVLGLAGGLAGLLFAGSGVRLVLFFQPGHVPGIDAAALNDRAMVFALILALATGLVCGAWPAARLVRARISGLLSGGRATTGLEVSRRRTIIVATEVALAVPLLVGGMLLLRTLVALQHVDPGFDPANAVQFRINLPARYATDDSRARFFSRLTEQLASIPGIHAVGGVSSLPLGGLNDTGGSIVYERIDGTLDETGVGTRAVTSGYFEALGVPLRQGRLLRAWGDDHAVVINERAAAALWPGANPVGRRLRDGTLADDPKDMRWLTVVGVVGDVRHATLQRPSNAEVFRSHTGNPWNTMTIVARTTPEQPDISGPIRHAVKTLDAELAVVGFSPVSAFIDGQLARPRFGAFCGAIFGGLGLLLAMAGTFAVLWLLVAQRAKEIGIRIAFGATPRSVASMIVAQSMRPAIAGAAVGILVAVWLSRTLESLLFGISARDPRMLLGSVALVLGAALLASWLPAHRAMRLNTVGTLRTD